MQLRQGTGEVKTIKARGPETRADGTPLGRNEVAHFEFDMAFSGGLAIDSLPVQLSDDPNTPEWDGEFSETIDIDSQAPGVYVLRYRTVDTIGNKSVNSEELTLEILPPLAIPNPPTSLA